MDFLSSLPGYLTAIIALLAVLVTIWPPVENKIKATWICVFVFLTLVTGWTIYKSDQANSLKESAKETQHAKETEGQVKRETDLLQYSAFLKGQISALVAQKSGAANIRDELTASFLKFSKSLPTTQNNEDSKEPLKKRATELSQDVISFLNDRDKLRPKYPSDMNTQGAMNNFMKEIMEYSTETMDLYSIYYSAKVIAIYNEFKLRGLTDRKMDENADVRYPTNEIGIRYIAEGLGALAQRLP